MAELKTRPSALDVDAHLAAIADERRRADCRALVDLMRRATGCEPVLWGDSIVGFDRYHYRYPSGHAGDWFIIGFASRKTDLTIYLLAGFDGQEALLARLGRHRLGKCCLYVKRLADLDPAVLDTLVRDAVAAIRRRHPSAPASDPAPVR